MVGVPTYVARPTGLSEKKLNVAEPAGKVPALGDCSGFLGTGLPGPKILSEMLSRASLIVLSIRRLRKPHKKARTGAPLLSDNGLCRHRVADATPENLFRQSCEKASTRYFI